MCVLILRFQMAWWWPSSGTTVLMRWNLLPPPGWLSLRFVVQYSNLFCLVHWFDINSTHCTSHDWIDFHIAYCTYLDISSPIVLNDHVIFLILCIEGMYDIVHCTAYMTVHFILHSFPHRMSCWRRSTTTWTVLLALRRSVTSLDVASTPGMFS